MMKSKINGLTISEIASISHYVRYKLGMTQIGIKLPEAFLNRPEVQKYIRKELEMYEVTGALKIKEVTKNE